MAKRIGVAEEGTRRDGVRLVKSMGLWMATALVIGNMIGSGVFTLPSAMAGVAVTNGSISILAWIFTGAGAVLLALVFANLGRAFPRTGGPYVYARRAFDLSNQAGAEGPADTRPDGPSPHIAVGAA